MKKLSAILIVALLTASILTIYPLNFAKATTIASYHSYTDATLSWTAMTTNGMGMNKAGMNGNLEYIQYYIKNTTKMPAGSMKVLLFSLSPTDSYPANGAVAFAESNTVDISSVAANGSICSCPYSSCWTCGLYTPEQNRIIL